MSTAPQGEDRVEAAKRILTGALEMLEKLGNTDPDVQVAYVEFALKRALAAIKGEPEPPHP